MLLKECYDAFGGSYEVVKTRLPKDSLIEKFVIKFLSEPSYDHLCQALAQEDYENAFRDAHSLKGVSLNLGFEKLGKSSGDLTEYLRGWAEKGIDQAQCTVLLEAVSEDYHAVISSIRKYMEA